jgi:hypothetical protein
LYATYVVQKDQRKFKLASPATSVIDSNGKLGFSSLDHLLQCLLAPYFTGRQLKDFETSAFGGATNLNLKVLMQKI